MKVFVTGTDTDVGKTLVSTWLCLHSGYHYFKPIQTGTIESHDTLQVLKIPGISVYEPCHIYKTPVSPHLAASLENDIIHIDKMYLPDTENLIIEGVGGVLVPINNKMFVIDLIKKLNTPVILVSRNKLGTINHTLLSIEAIRSRNIQILGVIMNGEHNQDNIDAIEYYGKVQVLASIPNLNEVNYTSLINVPLTKLLRYIFKI